MITCPGCGAEIPLSEALKEQFRHENEHRLKVLAGEAQQKARADFAVEKEFLKTQLAEERRRCREAQQAELELRKERGALEARARELDLEVAQPEYTLRSPGLTRRLSRREGWVPIRSGAAAKTVTSAGASLRTRRVNAAGSK